MSQPPLASTPVGTNTSYAKISPLELTLVDEKTSDPKILTLQTESSKRKEEVLKEYVLEDPDSDISLSDLSSSKSG